MDTNFIIHLTKRDNNAVNKYKEIKDNFLVTTTINVYEIFKGIYLSKTKLSLLSEIINELEILPLNVTEAKEAAQIRKELAVTGSLINETDILIAGIIRAQDIKIVTNDKDFKKIKNLKVVNY